MRSRRRSKATAPASNGALTQTPRLSLCARVRPCLVRPCRFGSRSPSPLPSTQLAKLQDELARKTKRDKRKAQETKAKQRERMRLQMDVPNDTGSFATDESLFSMRSIRSTTVRGRAVRASTDGSTACARADADAGCVRVRGVPR